MSASVPPTSGGDRERRSSPLRLGAQILGFVVGLGLLGYCIRVALQPRNQEQLAKLLDAPLHEKLSLVGLSIVVVLISGSVFHVAISPVKKLRWLDVQAVNVIACLLALLPMKLSLVFRVLMHNRRDRVPVLTIGAWFAAISAVMGVVIGPILGVTMLRGTPDALWAALSVGGAVACAALLLLVARTLRDERVWMRFAGVWSRVPVPGLLKSRALQERAHEGVRMLASPRAIALGMALRVVDIGVQAARFKIAAAIVDQPLAWDQAVLAGAMFFLIGALAPTGQVGAREAGTAGFLGMFLASIDFSSFAIVVLMVSATETVVLLVGSMLGLAYLRPDRLFRRAAAESGNAREP